MSRTRKIAASLIVSAGLVLSGVAAPAMAAASPATQQANEVKEIYEYFFKGYKKEVKASLRTSLS